MSEKIKNLNEGGEGEYKVPVFESGEVWNANWRDDIPEEGEAEDAEVKFEFFDNENTYQNQNEVDPETQRRIDLLRLKHMKIGQKVLSEVRKAA